MNINISLIIKYCDFTIYPEKCSVSLGNCFHLVSDLNANKSGEIDNIFLWCFIGTCGFQLSPSIDPPFFPWW